jgi:hypothetical protein
MPAIFGQAMAAYVLCDLAHKPFVPEGVGRLSRDQRHKLYHKLQERERATGQPLELDKDEVDFVFQEVWRGRSSISSARQGGRERLYLARWRPERPLRPDNVVFITTKELATLDAHGIAGFPDDVVARVDSHLRQYGDDWS